MIAKEILLTKEGFDKLKEELKKREKETRFEIADRIRFAKELGDLSENDEYKTAKEMQSLNETRILELRGMVLNARVDENFSHSFIGVGSKFQVRISGKEFEYSIVGSNEADPSSYRFSYESPIGKVFLNKVKGDLVTFKTPSGKIMEFEIIKIL